MAVIPLQGAPRKRPRASKRGIYRKIANRDATIAPAWTIGDATSFAKAKAITMERICLDPLLGGKAKAVLASCLTRMNCREQWSCFVSIPRLAEEVGCNKATCWRAIWEADGIYIATKAARRSYSQRYLSTHITIHPDMVAPMRPCVGDMVAPMQQQGRTNATTGSHRCEENFLYLTSINEPPSRSKNDFGKQEERGIRERRFEFESLETRRKSNREERLLLKGSQLCRDFERITGCQLFAEAAAQYRGRWIESGELAAKLGVEI